MASPVDARLILCDAAQADSHTGKLHMLGAGWSATGTPTPVHAVAVMLKVPWDRTNTQINVSLALVTDDGVSVSQPQQGGTTKPVKFVANVEVGRPPGVPHGSSIPAAFAITIPPMQLEPGGYAWRLEAAGTSDQQPFQVG